MRICGLQKLSMVDYPDRLAATVFTGGCDLRCPFCHNAPLVTRASEAPALSEEEVLAFLKHRRGLLDGVVLSGGEPLLQPDASDFLAKVELSPSNWTLRLEAFSIWDAKLPLLPVTSGTVVMASWSVLVYR